MIIYFVSQNIYKAKEVKTILDSDKIEIVHTKKKIDEIQSEDMYKITRDKALKAFKQIGRPVLTEHTGLQIAGFGNLPGGLTQIFWDSLQADAFSDFFCKAGITEVTAVTVFAYCDGKHVYMFDGKTEGHIVSPPRGDRSFQWDCIFMPVGENRTFAEMGKDKNKISMRNRALKKLKDFLEVHV